MIPRDYQQKAIESVFHKWTEFDRLLGVAPTGCHAVGQEILAYDGTLKRVEDIVEGELLMGPDSGPRTVLALCRGFGPMYRVIPQKGYPFIVNDAHLLSLVHTQSGKVIDVPIIEYLGWSKNQKHLHKLFRTSVDFDDHVGLIRPLSPYFLGIFLGDGCSRSGFLMVSKPDQEILAAVKDEAFRHGQQVRIETSPGRCPNYHLVNDWKHKASIKSALKMLGLFGLSSAQRFIPQSYKTASRNERLELLGGLLDTDGHCDKGGYDWISASKQLAIDFCFVARSVGLAAYVRECVKSCQNDYCGTYWRVSVSGDCSGIPCRIARKQAWKRRQKKNVLRTGFSLDPIEKAPFYGFRLSGDGQYLLGDFTVTHNSGKTIKFAHIANRRSQTGRVLILAHRDELLDQARDKLFKACSLLSSKEKAADYADLDAGVVVASVQTLSRDHRLQRFAHDHFRTVIVDEAHHTLAESYERILTRFDGAKVLGVTATPDRGDRRSLGRYYEDIAFEINLLDMIRDGWLCPIRIKTVPLEIDISRVGMRAGDYSEEELAIALEPLLQELAAAICTHAGTRKSLVFVPLVRTSNQFALILRSHGLAAESISGESPDRKEILARFASGETRVLCNAMLLTEGYDAPSIDCVVSLRPTTIRSLYAQQVGRGTRIHDGKKDLLLLDFLWLSRTHNLVGPASLIAKDEDEAAAVTSMLRKTDGDGDLLTAQRDVQAEREAALARRLNAGRKREAGEVSLLELAQQWHAPDVLNYAPSFSWEHKTATEKQIETLGRAGVDPSLIQSRGHASALIDSWLRFKEKEPATEKQKWFCHYRGHPNPWQLTKPEASRWIAANKK
jgi:superfamily II DNA or RNA helicase